MGDYRSRREGFLSARSLMIADLMFKGKTDEQIIEVCFPNAVGDPKATKNARASIRTLTKNPKFIEYYKSLVTEWSVHNHGKALTRLSEQLHSNEPWLLNKAINDTLNRTTKVLMGDEENTITVKVEGAPVLGSPADEEVD